MRISLDEAFLILKKWNTEEVGVGVASQLAFASGSVTCLLFERPFRLPATIHD